MTPDQLFETAEARASQAVNILRSIRAEPEQPSERIRMATSYLRGAMAALQNLENLANGQKPPMADRISPTWSLNDPQGTSR